MATRPAAKRKSVSSPRVSARPAAKKAPVKVAATRPAAKKPASKSVSTAPRKPVTKIVAKSLKPVVAKSVTAVVKTKPVSATKTISKPKKVKLVRNNFSLPASEHSLLLDLKKRAKKLDKEFKKSEILRAGVAHLVSMADSVLVAALNQVERVKTVRPAKKKGKKK